MMAVMGLGTRIRLLLRAPIVRASGASAACISPRPIEKIRTPSSSAPPSSFIRGGMRSKALPSARMARTAAGAGSAQSAAASTESSEARSRDTGRSSGSRWK